MQPRLFHLVQEWLFISFDLEEILVNEAQNIMIAIHLVKKMKKSILSSILLGKYISQNSEVRLLEK